MYIIIYLQIATHVSHRRIVRMHAFWKVHPQYRPVFVKRDSNSELTEKPV